MNAYVFEKDGENEKMQDYIIGLHVRMSLYTGDGRERERQNKYNVYDREREGGRKKDKTGERISVTEELLTELESD